VLAPTEGLGGVALVGGVLQNVLNLQNIIPKNGLGSIRKSSPKRFFRVIFGFEYNRKVFILFSCYSSQSCFKNEIKNEIFVKCMDDFDGQTPIIFRLAT
jgi:hypothetical protein